jgi:tRNA threonylcarbamoyl adenosine modification protein (Sua5/YciO/YrdC/YwlC family)
MLVTVHPQNPQPRIIKRLIDSLKEGGVIVYPTDTVYGLGCNIFDQKAIERICLIKGIDPRKARFSFVCSSLSDMSSYTRSISNPIFRLLRSLLPGPYTFILPAGKLTPKILKTKRDTVGIRVPDNIICQSLIKELGHPILSTSLPGDDEEYLTDPEVMEEKFGSMVDMVVDGGTGGQVPSTVIDCTGEEPELIRAGLGQWPPE